MLSGLNDKNMVTGLLSPLVRILSISDDIDFDHQRDLFNIKPFCIMWKISNKMAFISYRKIPELSSVLHSKKRQIKIHMGMNVYFRIFTRYGSLWT